MRKLLLCALLVGTMSCDRYKCSQACNVLSGGNMWVESFQNGDTCMCGWRAFDPDIGFSAIKTATITLK